MVAARVKGQDDEENWILAEVVTYNTATSKYDVDDIDADDGNEYVSLACAICGLVFNCQWSLVFVMTCSLTG